MPTLSPGPSTTCVGCGQSDNHPKDTVVLPGDQVVRWHLDCHALADPPCETCAKQIKGLKKGSIGEDMRAHLTKGWKD